MQTHKLTDGGILLYDDAFLPPDLASKYFTELLEQTPWEQKPGVFGHLQPRLTASYGDDDSVGMHADDEPGMDNVIGSLSLGSTRTFRIKHNKSKETMSFQVANGTLIIMAGTMQQFWKHEVPKTRENVGERVNLTFRWIEKG